MIVHFLRRASKLFNPLYIFNQLRNPSSRTLLSVLTSVHILLQRISRRPSPQVRSVFLWDIRSQPVTFDFVFAILGAYLFFIDNGVDRFEVVIYAPLSSKPTSWRNYDSFVNSSAYIARIADMIIPIAESFSCVYQVTRITSFSQLPYDFFRVSLIYPQGYHPTFFFPHTIDYKQIFHNLLNHTSNRFHIPFLDPSRSCLPAHHGDSTSPSTPTLLNNSSDSESSYITLTLRDYGFSPLRNTTQYDVDLIYKFACDHDFLLLIIPDDEKRLNDYVIPPGAIVKHNARTCLRTRMRLYDESECNFFTAAGVAAISYFLPRAKSILLNYGLNNTDNSVHYNRKNYGLEFGNQPYKVFGAYLIWSREPNCYCIQDLNNAYISISNR